MKVVITESRLESLIIDYLNDSYYPDYGWANPDVYQKDVKQYGKDFLVSLQELKDYDIYWYAKGLTPDGKIEVKRIKLTFDLK